MKNRLTGAVVAAALAVCVVSACSGQDRHFGSSSGAGGTGTTGGSEAKAGNSASAGSRPSAGFGGALQAGGQSPADAAGSSGEAGSAGEAGSCQGADCASCAGVTPKSGTPCGECGTYVCNSDQTTTSCSDPKFNACGGCGELAAVPGAACGVCGTYECAPDKASVACKDPGKNACGGCGTLASAPNSSCGSCGDWQCTADKSGVKCSGVNANACGGCGTLANAPGVACGQCGKFECSADKASTVCSDPGKNACGGCTAFPGTLGAACGACLVTTCAADKNSLECKSQCTGTQVCASGLNQCKTPDCSAANSCGKSDGAGSTCTNSLGKCLAKPNSTGSCSGSSCAYVCKVKTLSCSTAAEPACGSWDFESNTAEGWSLDPSNSGGPSAASGGLYLATPPGAGAGAHSLALNIDGTGTDSSYIEISLNLCPGNALATGIQGAFRASVWFKPTDGGGGVGGPGYATLQSGNSSIGGIDSNCPANQWFEVPTQPVAGVSVSHVDLSIGGLEGRKGVLYFDNLRFD